MTTKTTNNSLIYVESGELDLDYEEELQMQWEIQHDLEQHLNMQAEQDAEEHEENIDHPEGSEYPVSVNVPHMKVMRDRVIDSVFNRTGINIRDFDSIIHATTSPGRDEKGNILDYANNNIIRNV